MLAFTYKDYIYYRKILKTKKIDDIFQLREKEEDYIYEVKNLHQPHDKIFKEILDDKEETVEFINQMLKFKNIKYKLKPESIEKYKRKFITKEFNNIESDVIYKKIDQNVFFLIEHQSTIDYSMPYRILKYNMAIMEDAIDKNKVRNKNYKLPVIYSFVIYTGKRKWNANRYIAEKQETLEGTQKNIFGKFQIMDVNDYTQEELLNSNNLLSKIMLLEKANTMEELEGYLQIILEGTIRHKQRNFLQRIFQYMLKDKVSDKKYNEMIKIIEGKRGEKGMKVKVEQSVEDLIFETMANKIIERAEEAVRKKKELAKIEKKIKEKEEEYNRKEEEYNRKEKEYIIKKKELEIREKSINDKKDNIVIGMLKNKIDDNLIMELLKIDEKELIKIKNENNFDVKQ